MISIRFSCATARQPASGPGRKGSGAVPDAAPAFRLAESRRAMTASMAPARRALTPGHASRLRRDQRRIQIRDQVVDVHELR
jgi:hypothetical protein